MLKKNVLQILDSLQSHYSEFNTRCIRGNVLRRIEGKTETRGLRESRAKLDSLKYLIRIIEKLEFKDEKPYVELSDYGTYCDREVFYHDNRYKSYREDKQAMIVLNTVFNAYIKPSLGLSEFEIKEIEITNFLKIVKTGLVEYDKLFSTKLLNLNYDEFKREDIKDTITFGPSIEGNLNLYLKLWNENENSTVKYIATGRQVSSYNIKEYTFKEKNKRYYKFIESKEVC